MKNLKLYELPIDIKKLIDYNVILYNSKDEDGPNYYYSLINIINEQKIEGGLLNLLDDMTYLVIPEDLYNSDEIKNISLMVMECSKLDKQGDWTREFEKLGLYPRNCTRIGMVLNSKLDNGVLVGLR